MKGYIYKMIANLKKERKNEKKKNLDTCDMI